ncbi:hypothetical protein [Streptomyces sp. NPDC059850]|uniref:hypothetical protein n=1 Tax=Streptomyces sp. NPDC059850 TaxID=3346970 RepID=UPI003667DB58
MTADQQAATPTSEPDPNTLTREQFQGGARVPRGEHPATPEPNAWGRFLDHAMGCPACRTGQRCADGNGLHHAVRDAFGATAP